MNRSIQALIAGVALLGGTALAQTAPPPGGSAGETTPSTGAKQKRGGHGQHGMQQGAQGGMGETGATANVSEPKKHIMSAEIYLRDALNNAKVLYQLTQEQPGKLDKMIERESIGNIERSISSLQTHLTHIRTMPEARVQDTQDVTQLQSDLTQARAVLGQIKKASGDKQQLGTYSAQLFSVLQTADTTFGRVADSANAQRIDRINVPERQPVRGGGEGGIQGGSQGGMQGGGSTGGTMPAPGSSIPQNQNQPQPQQQQRPRGGY